MIAITSSIDVRENPFSKKTEAEAAMISLACFPLLVTVHYGQAFSKELSEKGRGTVQYHTIAGRPSR